MECRALNAAIDSLGIQVIGMCEVENKFVIQELQAKLNKSTFEIVHYESPDQRGIDNALIYNTAIFELIESGPIRVELGGQSRPTRDILLVRLLENSTQQEFAVFVDHWPSRLGGEEKSKIKRITVSNILSEAISTTRKSNPEAIIVAMGDFNDHPSDESMLQLTNCDVGPCLTNFHAAFDYTDIGSYVYRGNWEVLDQILVNNRKSPDTHWRASQNNSGFVRYNWMMYKNEKDQTEVPSKTYGGSYFYSGFSDHLPAYLILEKK
jgi:predicted extracellular nuclease